MLIIIYEDSRTAKSCSILLNFLVKGSIRKKEMISQICSCRTCQTFAMEVSKSTKEALIKHVPQYMGSAIIHCIAVLIIVCMKCRSSHSQMFFKVGVLKNFATLTGKHLFQRLKHRYSSVDFAKFLRAAFFTEHCWWKWSAYFLPSWK